jgi:spermidine/putrescine ABC transporter ATP-binding subunit
MSTVPAIRLDRLSKSYDAHLAVAPTTLSIEAGELLTLLGPSGCGKSTALGMIAGFVQPTGGDVFVHGVRVTDTPTFLRDVGVVFQSYALFPHMSVYDNVAFGLRMRGLPSAEIDRRVNDALTMVRMESMGKRRPAKLSGGQQQRVALARAIVIRPKVLLLDEPLSALDKNLRADMQVEIREIQRAVGITTILVTHDQNEALSMSDRIAVMKGGAIQQVGTPGEIYDAPVNAFVASFVGEVNRIPVTIAERSGVETIVVLPGGARKIVPARKVQALDGGNDAVLFVRPQGLKLVCDGGGEVAGRVTASVFQGTHIDLHMVSEAGSRLRALVPQGSGRPPVDAGCQCRLAIADDAISLLCGTGMAGEEP